MDFIVSRQLAMSKMISYFIIFPVPTALPACISKATPGQQLFLTQSSGGLTPVALSQVILPVTSPGAGAGSSQPIYLTTQVRTCTELTIRHPSTYKKTVEALTVDKLNGM